MNITIEQELAAMVRFLLNEKEDITPYFLQVPSDFQVPAIFFPVPESQCKKVTFSTVKTEMVWRIRFLAADDTEAYKMAVTAQNRVIEADNKIPLYEVDGTEIEKRLQIGHPHITKLGTGIIQMELNCARYTGILKPTTKAEDMVFEGLGYDEASVTRAYLALAESSKVEKKEDEDGSGKE